MKLKICLVGLLCLFFKAQSQTKTNITATATNKYLTVGDHVPDILITNIINSGMKTARISDYKAE